MICWRKLAAAKWEDAWLERLAWLGPTRLAITTLAGARSIRIEAWGLTRRETNLLTSQFGGTIRRVARDFFSASPVPHHPVRIRRRLLITASEDERQKWAGRFPDRQVLVIPATIAFGSGDHPTTASCLRLLSDEANRLASQRWDLLDLGCGSGILAIAGRALGADHALACDVDPLAVRAARDNVRHNHLRGIVVQRLDVTAWHPPRRWQVVTANLYSAVLIRAAASITHALATGGALILSGMLREQAAECLAAYQARGLQAETVVHRGRWTTALLRQPESGQNQRA